MTPAGLRLSPIGPHDLECLSQKENVMGKLVAAAALATVAAFPAFAQSYDPSIGSGNLNTTTGSPGIYAPPGSFCEVRRMQFSDAYGWRVRDVLVCCTLGQCTYRLSY
jgi:hypothetical protein